LCTKFGVFTVSSAEAMGLFAQKSGMKLFANQGDIEVQAQNANLNMAAKQDIKVDSVDGEVTITAKDNLTLICGGSYIKISSEGIELGTQDNIYLKCNVFQKMGPKALGISTINLPQLMTEHGIKFHFVDDQGGVYANEPYIAVLPDGKEIHGITDKEGKTKAFYTDSPDSIDVQLTRLI
jgi:type VI secretion system secreted protein VgrG